MAAYSLQQQVFALSLVSNAASGHSGAVAPLEAVLQQAVEAFFQDAQPYIGAWTLAWGPVVAQPPGASAAGNAMFVARGTDSGGGPVYVVAVAGTNPLSLYDLMTEDFDTTLQPWPYPVPAGAAVPRVTQGTLDGLQYLLQMTDPATGAPLQGYLAGVRDSGATLVFTGHSLGGALSPALALALFGSPRGGGPGPGSWGAVRLYPVAGPTVGDAAYAQLWAGVFPPVSDAAGETWNLLVWNSLDVVPLAWARLSALSTLYSGITWTPCLGNIQAGMEAHAAASGGTFVQPQNQALPGSFAPWEHVPLVAPQVTYFLTEALHQHVWAYFDLLNATEVRPLIVQRGDPIQQPVQLEVEGLAIKLAATYCG